MPGDTEPTTHQIELTMPYQASDGRLITLRALRFGDATQNPPVLLHHANGMCAAMWAPVARQLTDLFTVYALDARGHGDSDHLQVPHDYPWSAFVDDLATAGQQLLEWHGGESFVAGIGSSFGGIVTAAAQAAHGGLFEQVFMFDPPIHNSPDLVEALGLPLPTHSTDDRAELVARTLKRRVTWPSREAAVEAWRNKPLFAPWTEEAFHLYVNQGMRELDGQVTLKCPVKVEAHIFETTGALSILDYAPKVSVPVQFVHANKGFFDGTLFRGLAGLFPDGHFSELPAGHMLPFEVPDQVAAFIRQHAAQ